MPLWLHEVVVQNPVCGAAGYSSEVTRCFCHMGSVILTPLSLVLPLDT